MNLLNKISIWFIAIMLLITPITMYISYTNIKKRLDNAEIERLQSVNKYVAAQLQRGETPAQTSQGMPITVTHYDAVPAINPAITYTYEQQATGIKKNECLVHVNSFVSVNNTVYKISSYNYVTETEEILKGMLKAVVWKVFLIILAVAITARILSVYILRPFRHSIDIIRNFDLQQKEKLQFIPTSTKEFKELNEFLKAMTEKAVQDYTLVKEFSENASHELQTPVAIIQSKIELLAETNIDSRQAALITDMQNAVDKLSRINSSLTLLTKLDNQEFHANKDLQFCNITEEIIAAFYDRMTLKNISLDTAIDKNVKVKIHPSLGEILVSNLLTNAIRHNVEGGSVSVVLTQNYLQVSNTGLPPGIPTEELFQRFKKGNQSANSIGLGLSIIKQICEVNHFLVRYDYKDSWHCVKVCFNKNEKIQPFQPTTVPVSVTANPVSKV